MVSLARPLGEQVPTVGVKWEMGRTFPLHLPRHVTVLLLWVRC